MTSTAEESTTTILSERQCNLEDLIIVWLDETINDNNSIWSKRQNRLQGCVNFIRTFVDKTECVKYISTICDEHIFLIVSGSIGEIIIPEIHDRTQLYGIYIFCCDIIKHNQWSKPYSKVRGVFNDENHLIMYLEKDAKMYSNTLLPFNIAQSNERSLQDIDEEQVAFIWFQLMIEVLSRLPQSSISKKEMIDECRSHYADNPTQLSMIEEFYTEYNANCAINWYTKNCFLYRLLNKAFRTENIDIIFNYHYFLSDLNKELTKLCLNQYGDKKGILTVYRGQSMHINELEKLKTSVGHLVSINTFFSASTSSPVASSFCGNGEGQSHGIESIIFQIEVDLSIKRRPFANISQSSQTSHENEILFGIGSIFRIQSVELFLDNIWLCILTLTDEVKKEIEDLLAYFTAHIGIQPSLLELGVLLSKTGDFERAKRFYLRLENELPKTHSDLGVLYNNLGEIFRKQGHIDTAMKYYVLAIDQFISSFDFFHPWFAIVHSNIAMIFDARHQFDEALVSYQCALCILEHHDNGYESELFSTIYNGIAAIYQQRGQFEKALELYKKTLSIEGNILPSNHPSIAVTFNNIGELYFAMKDFSEAREYFLKALPIITSTLPDNHHQLALLYGSMGTIYIFEKENSKAIEYYLRAEEILDRSPLTFDHTLREDTYRALTIVSRYEKMFDLSIRMHHKLINLYKAQTPADQYQIADWTYSLGNMLFDRKDHQQAFQYYQLSINIIEKLPRTEKNKDLYLIIIDNFRRFKQFDILIEHYTRLLNEETNHHSIFAGKLNNNLGVVYDHMDNNVLALKHYTAALTCYENQSNISTKEIAIIHHNMAVILSNLNDYDAARSNLCKALNILTELDYDIRAQCYYSLGEIDVKNNEWSCAQKHFGEALELATQANMNQNFIQRCALHLQQAITNLEKTASTNLELLNRRCFISFDPLFVLFPSLLYLIMKEILNICF